VPKKFVTTLIVVLMLSGCASFEERLAEKCVVPGEPATVACRRLFVALQACGYKQVKGHVGRLDEGGELVYFVTFEDAEWGEMVFDPVAQHGFYILPFAEVVGHNP